MLLNYLLTYLLFDAPAAVTSSVKLKKKKKKKRKLNGFAEFDILVWLLCSLKTLQLSCFSVRIPVVQFSPFGEWVIGFSRTICTVICTLLCCSAGDLHFAYTIVDDTHNKPSQYRCGAYNPYLGSSFGGSLWSLTVSGSSNIFYQLCRAINWDVDWSKLVDLTQVVMWIDPSWWHS